MNIHIHVAKAIVVSKIHGEQSRKGSSPFITTNIFKIIKMKKAKPYKCRKCNKEGCKLWRTYMTFDVDLLCVDCSVEEQKDPQVSTAFAALYAAGPIHFKEDGFYQSSVGYTDTIGWRVPAIPISSMPKAYWGVGGSSSQDYNTWSNLPLRT